MIQPEYYMLSLFLKWIMATPIRSMIMNNKKFDWRYKRQNISEFTMYFQYMARESNPWHGQNSMTSYIALDLKT